MGDTSMHACGDASLVLCRDVGMATPDHTPGGRGYDSSLSYFYHTNDYWNFTVRGAPGERGGGCTGGERGGGHTGLVH